MTKKGLPCPTACVYAAGRNGYPGRSDPLRARNAGHPIIIGREGPLPMSPGEKKRRKMIYKFTRTELKTKKASDFQEGDIIETGPNWIHIHYKSKNGHIYSMPALCSFHERMDFRRTGCTPGEDRPYYIDDFLKK